MFKRYRKNHDKNIEKERSGMRKNYVRFLPAALVLFISSAFIPAYAVPYSMQGKVIDGSTQKPVNFAIVIIQEAGLVANAPQGNYYMEIPKSGRYAVKVQSPGLESITAVVTIEGNVTRNFILNPFVSKGNGIVIKGEKDIQKISRHTMSKKEIKEVPASFGDSLNALTALPSVSRPMGIFGPLIIRGADSAVNGYFIDDIPLFNPMHFGGFHSVINNDLMREIDLYASSYPSQFSNAQGAVININTIDEVAEPGGNVDVGLISACVLVKRPITEETYVDGKEKSVNKGYIIASARIGYLSLFIPLFYEYVLNQNIDQVPEYWDYQFKAKYYINDSNSLTVLAFGSRDDMKLILKDKYLDEGADPYWVNATWEQNQESHNAGIYYTFKPKESFSNTLLAYGAMTDFYRWLELPAATADWAKDVGITSRPYIFGFKDKIKFEWWKSHGELRAGAEFNFYRFQVDGAVLMPKENIVVINPGDPDSVEKIYIDETIVNKTLVHFIENKFTFGWVTLVPGYHAEYLAAAKKQTFDPRGAVSIAFPTGTTIGAAGGYYSCFMQTNATYFNDYPNLAKADYLDPQRSIHRAVSLEQKVSDYTFKVEGFYNNFRDIVYAESQGGSDSSFYNGSELKAYGFELMAKINEEREQGLFGWASYTYSQSKMKSNMESDTYGDEWLYSYYDQTHVGKLVAGYTYKNHTVSAKFQFYSSTPYSPITGSDRDLTYPGPSERWVPSYGKTNSERLGPGHELDIRYSYKTNYKWGFVTWYIEVINATNYRGEDVVYDYRYSYSDRNPRTEKMEGLAMFPNFGVEAKF
ncbi:MAG TPA: TonB-dependent receptor plug domain-containing protein [Spirochaetota bacterium]|nr:TonB-dependent receptor plug domain-containing protein [Spirochaetota bacterium]